MDFTVEELKEITEAMHVLEENRLAAMFDRLKASNYRLKFLQKGDETVYFVRSESGNQFGKAVFGKTGTPETMVYGSAAELLADAKRYEDEGYKVMDQSKVTRFLLFMVRLIGRLSMLDGAMWFLLAVPMTILALASGGSAVAGGLALSGGAAIAGTIKIAAGWFVVQIAKRKPADKRNKVGDLNVFNEANEIDKEKIREIVQNKIKDKCDELTTSSKKEDIDEDK